MWALSSNRVLTIGAACGKLDYSRVHLLAMVGSRPNREESVGSQRPDQLLNLERRRDREISVHTTRMSGSQSRSGSRVSHGENTRNMQLEIDHLWRKLRHKRRRKTPSSSKPSSNNDNDDSCRPRSRTPPQ